MDPTIPARLELLAANARHCPAAELVDCLRAILHDLSIDSEPVLAIRDADKAWALMGVLASYGYPSLRCRETPLGWVLEAPGHGVLRISFAPEVPRG